jgi:glycosyltransferase involved in cell wall biosynthesis
MTIRNGKAPESISVFFPAYNDAPSLPALLATSFRTLEENFADYEVIVVNDGSSDGTDQVLARLQQHYGAPLRIVTHEKNQGYGAALRSGFASASKELVFYTDGDGQYDPAELMKLYRSLGPETGLVNGYKLARNDPWGRVWIGNVYNRFARLLFGVRLRDIDCDFRLIRRSVLDALQLRSTSGTICVELVRKIELSGCGVEEVGVRHYPRLHGRSQFFRFRSLLTTLYQLIRLRIQLFFLFVCILRPAVEECLSLP